MTNPRRRNKEQMVVLKEQIAHRREQGYTNQEIAEELGISCRRVTNIASKLIAEKKISRLPGGRASFWYNLQDERCKTIIKMVKEGASLRSIASEVGYTHEWIRQVITRIRNKHGDEIFSSSPKTK